MQNNIIINIIKHFKFKIITDKVITIIKINPPIKQTKFCY